MRGRKPVANAVRRGDNAIGPVKVQAEVIGQAAGLQESSSPHVEKPVSVALSETQSALWDTVVGTGLGFEQKDVPMLEQLVFTLDVAREARARTVAEDGRPILMVGKGQPDPVTGEYMDYAPNPYIKQAEAAANHALKLADQLGCTPLARARLGLTQAMGASVTLSIADQIDRAISRGKGGE